MKADRITPYNMPEPPIGSLRQLYLIRYVQLKPTMKDLLLFREKQINVAEFEKENNLNLPPVYRSFISAFKPYFGFINCLDESDNIKNEFMTHIFSSKKKENYENR